LLSVFAFAFVFAFVFVFSPLLLCLSLRKQNLLFTFTPCAVKAFPSCLNKNQYSDSFTIVK